MNCRKHTYCLNKVTQYNHLKLLIKSSENASKNNTLLLADKLKTAQYILKWANCFKVGPKEAENIFVN